MLHNGRAQQVEADDVVAHVRTEAGSDRFCDLDGRKLNATLSDHIAGKRRSGDAVRPSAVKKRLDLSVASHAFGKTSPARALARAEHWSHQGENAARLDENPRCAVRQMLPVQFGQLSFEIIAHQRDRQVG
jgi:hypothetical protein